MSCPYLPEDLIDEADNEHEVAKGRLQELYVERLDSRASTRRNQSDFFRLDSPHREDG